MMGCNKVWHNLPKVGVKYISSRVGKYALHIYPGDDSYSYSIEYLDTAIPYPYPEYQKEKHDLLYIDGITDNSIFSKNEMHVAFLISHGVTNDLIKEIMEISPQQVTRIVKKIKKKLSSTSKIRLKEKLSSVNWPDHLDVLLSKYYNHNKRKVHNRISKLII